MENYVNAKKVLPLELIEEIKKYYTGPLYIPKGHKSHDRRRLVIALKEQNTSTTEIAQLAGLTTRRVQQILLDEKRKKRSEPRQPSDSWLKDNKHA